MVSAGKQWPTVGAGKRGRWRVRQGGKARENRRRVANNEYGPLVNAGKYVTNGVAGDNSGKT